MNNETMVYYPLTDTWEAVSAAAKVESTGATAAPAPAPKAQDAKTA